MPLLALPSLQVDIEHSAQLPAVALARVRGEHDPDKLLRVAISDLAKRDLQYVLSVMLRPDEPADHHRLSLATDLRHAHDAQLAAAARGWEGDFIGLYPHLIGRNEPSDLIKELVHGRQLGPRAAGFILRLIVARHMHEKRPSASGVGETAKVFARQCQDNRVSGGSLENIKQNLWPRFRPVSHLWAAWDVAAAAKVDLLAPVGFFLFLGTAAWLLEECCQIVPKGARRPVLTVDAAWIVPEAIIDRGPDRGIRNRIPIATN